MIKNSFVLLEKIGQNTEKIIWNSGIRTWDDFLQAKEIKKVNPLRKSFYDRQLIKAKQELAKYNSSYFTDKLNSGHHYRLYDHFKEDIRFLDIETSGFYGDITVIGMYNGYDTKTLVRGKNLNRDTIKAAFGDSKLIITFNGASFDLPVINRYFNGIIPNIPHIDLRHVCSKIGLTGGLKNIDKTLKIKRADEVENMNGADAVYLWQQYKST